MVAQRLDVVHDDESQEPRECSGLRIPEGVARRPRLLPGISFGLLLGIESSTPASRVRERVSLFDRPSSSCTLSFARTALLVHARPATKKTGAKYSGRLCLASSRKGKPGTECWIARSSVRGSFKELVDREKCCQSPTLVLIPVLKSPQEPRVHHARVLRWSALACSSRCRCSRLLLKLSQSKSHLCLDGHGNKSQISKQKCERSKLHHHPDWSDYHFNSLG